MPPVLKLNVSLTAFHRSANVRDVCGTSIRAARRSHSAKPQSCREASRSQPTNSVASQCISPEPLKNNAHLSFEFLCGFPTAWICFWKDLHAVHRCLLRSSISRFPLAQAWRHRESAMQRAETPTRRGLCAEFLHPSRYVLTRPPNSSSADTHFAGGSGTGLCWLRMA